MLVTDRILIPLHLGARCRIIIRMGAILTNGDEVTLRAVCEVIKEFTSKVKP